MNVWELPYFSTSCAEDNDSDIFSEESGEEGGESEMEEISSGEEQESTKDVAKDGEEKATFKTPKQIKADEIFDKKAEGQGNNVPNFLKKIRQEKLMKPKEKKGLSYSYTYTTNEDGNNGPPNKAVIVRRAIESKGPQNLIDVLIMQKQNMYQREQHMKILND